MSVFRCLRDLYFPPTYDEDGMLEQQERPFPAGVWGELIAAIRTDDISVLHNGEFEQWCRAGAAMELCVRMKDSWDEHIHTLHQQEDHELEIALSHAADLRQQMAARKRIKDVYKRDIDQARSTIRCIDDFADFVRVFTAHLPAQAYAAGGPEEEAEKARVREILRLQERGQVFGPGPRLPTEVWRNEVLGFLAPREYDGSPDASKLGYNGHAVWTTIEKLIYAIALSASRDCRDNPVMQQCGYRNKPNRIMCNVAWPRENEANLWLDSCGVELHRREREVAMQMGDPESWVSAGYMRIKWFIQLYPQIRTVTAQYLDKMHVAWEQAKAQNAASPRGDVSAQEEAADIKKKAKSVLDLLMKLKDMRRDAAAIEEFAVAEGGFAE